MPLSHANDKCGENGYDWLQCICCPYGYHIDLDFVQYCESIGHQQVERSGSIKRRRERRRQRQSKEVLLGLAPSFLLQHQQRCEPPPLPPIRDLSQHVQRSPAQALGLGQQQRTPVIQDELFDVVNDFEKTWQRSATKAKRSYNLPDVTAILVADYISRAPSGSVSSMSSASTSGSSMTVLHSSGDGIGARDFDNVSIESCSLSPAALHSIREQMALGLERTKELEETVNTTIPALKAELATLKEENKQLHRELSNKEVTHFNKINRNYDRFENEDQIRMYRLPPAPLPPRRDFGVSCGVLVRHVGVGSQKPYTKTASTTTHPDDSYVDRWFKEKSKFLNFSSQSCESERPIEKPKVRDCFTQTLTTKTDASIQTNTVANKITTEFATQTLSNKTISKTIGVNTHVQTSHAATQNVVQIKSIATSDDTIDDTFCLKCNITKNTVGVGTSDGLRESQLLQHISLAALSTRSKSFHLGEEKLNITLNKHASCQYEPSHLSHKASQHEIKSISKHSQHDLIQQLNKAIQYENHSKTKCTDTKDLAPVMVHKACECVEPKAEQVEIGCNTTHHPEATSKEQERCAKCSISSADYDELAKKEELVSPSRIPRPQIPTTPVENRKFKRQDTYTKIPAEKSPTTDIIGLSALELVTTKTITTEQKLNIKLLEEAKTGPNGVNTEPALSDNALCQPSSPRKKCVPSKEMQAAMKVLNDSLQKSQGRDTRGLLNKNANNIVQTEWFRISSTVNADPLDVEDYLDCFEEFTSVLLEHIVNMVDASGNTAMHYAVSHGNFDVVSILLDSKVCDINKQNKAGYTSVMLVSLAEVRSDTHANVARRLFSLADVNIRAKQHGQTALMLAVSHGRLDMVSMLLEAGADINIQDEDGSTALMCAAEHGHIDIVKHFLSHPDCDSSISDVDGSTALKIAMEAGHRHIGVLLYAHERNLHGAVVTKPKKPKSTPASPKTPSSPQMQRNGKSALLNK